MKKYIKKSQFLLASVVSMLAGLEIPFNTFTYSYIFEIITKHRINLILPFVVIVIVVYGILSLIDYLKNVIVNRNIITINNQIKVGYVNGAVIDVDQGKKNFESNKLSFFMNDLKLLENNYWRQLFSILGAITTVTVTLIYALYNNALITLIFLIFMAVPSFAPRLFKSMIQNRTDIWSHKNQEVSSVVRDLFHGAFTLKRYLVPFGFDSRLKQKINGMEKANASVENGIAFSNSFISFLFYVCSYGPIGIGIFFKIRGVITLPQFVAIQYSSSWILNGFNTIISSVNTINSTSEIRKQVKKLTEVSELYKANSRNMNDDTFKELALNNLNYAYKNKSIIFKNLNFTARRGDKILIKGRSGIGKSTLLKIILREIKETSGEVLLNNQIYTGTTAYQTFGVVSQAPIIFHDTVWQNLTLGKKVTRSQVESALNRAGLSSFTDDKELFHVIDEEGKDLSGGQLKRIEIARALLMNREVLLVDEGTASLDTETSVAIHKLLFAIPDLTLIEVDHHIPDEIMDNYNRIYEIKDHQLV